MALTLSDNQFSAFAKLVLSAPEYKERIGFKEAFKTMKSFFSETKDSFDHGRKVPTVLLVPGIACRSAVMKVLGEPLKDEFNVAYCPDFNTLGFSDIRDSAIILREKIDEVLREHTDDVYIMAHSLGSLVALESLRHRNGVSKLVMLSPPLKGSQHANFVKSFSSACRQLSPGSDYLRSIEDINLDHTEVHSYIAADDVVVPVGSQVPHRELSETQELYMKPYLHHDFIIGLKARDFADKIKAVLRG